MNDYSLNRLYEVLRKDLIDWTGDNKKLRDKITPHNLNYLFEFHKRKGLGIDLCRFEKAYYESVFYPPEEKKELTEAFVKKIGLVIRNTLIRIGKEEITLTITVRHKISEVSYWRTVYIGNNFDGRNISPMSRKDEDWQ